MLRFLKHFFFRESELYVIEFGHSVLDKRVTVGPWSREMYILHYVVKGNCDFSGTEVSAGNAFFVSKGKYHTFTTSPDYEHYWIGFSGSGIKQLFCGMGLSHDQNQIFEVKHGNIAEMLFSRTELTAKDSPEDEACVAAKATLTAVLSLLSTKVGKETEECENYAEKIRLFIKANYMHPIKMADIAKKIGYSEKYMYRIFIEKYGLSPQQYLINSRMAAAKSQLLQTDMKINEIARAAGYNSVPSFSRTFVHHVGVTPREYRRSGRMY